MRREADDENRDIPLEEFEYTLNVNLRASFVLVKGVIEGMKAQKWGRIIFMSSIAAYGGGINGCRTSFLPPSPPPPFSQIHTKNPPNRLRSLKRRPHINDEESLVQTRTSEYLGQ